MSDCLINTYEGGRSSAIDLLGNGPKIIGVLKTENLSFAPSLSADESGPYRQIDNYQMLIIWSTVFTHFIVVPHGASSQSVVPVVVFTNVPDIT